MKAIERLKALCEKATVLPWSDYRCPTSGYDARIVNNNGTAECGDWLVAGVRWQENADFIIAIANAAPALLAIAEAAERAMENGDEQFDFGEREHRVLLTTADAAALREKLAALEESK